MTLARQALPLRGENNEDGNFSADTYPTLNAGQLTKLNLALKSSKFPYKICKIPQNYLPNIFPFPAMWKHCYICFSNDALKPERFQLASVDGQVPQKRYCSVLVGCRKNMDCCTVYGCSVAMKGRETP